VTGPPGCPTKTGQDFNYSVQGDVASYQLEMCLFWAAEDGTRMDKVGWMEM
jgi:hypothetical protein